MSPSGVPAAGQSMSADSMAGHRNLFRWLFHFGLLAVFACLLCFLGCTLPTQYANCTSARLCAGAGAGSSPQALPTLVSVSTADVLLVHEIQAVGITSNVP